MSNRIRFFRRRKGIAGISQKELAKQVGTFQTVISDYERGVRPIPKARMILIAEVLGESLEVIFPDTDKPIKSLPRGTPY